MSSNLARLLMVEYCQIASVGLYMTFCYASAASHGAAHGSLYSAKEGKSWHWVLALGSAVSADFSVRTLQNPRLVLNSCSSSYVFLD